ncbi:unnamed protein product [Heligmosomoides polygyrus]|uniref:Laminin G domain-containing protein n=1 Tax=Heligmosomoides polygyrus TaxID=6339 RepID=A0A3P8BEZ8_HELPZ|nr:unnamed protein product [Heligmosomoides polygyrus]
MGKRHKKRWSLSCETFSEALRPRRSCRHHYLADVYSTSVLPLQGDVDVIITEVQSGLGQVHRITDSLSIIIIRDYFRDLEQVADVAYMGGARANQAIYIDGLELSLMAGIRHIIPQNWDSEILATVVASPLRCQQKVLAEPNCLFRSQVGGRFWPVGWPLSWSWEFAFRTQRSSQNLFSLHTSDAQTLLVRLERDFFLRTDSPRLTSVGQLSDGRWHTVTIHLQQGDVFFTVDDSDKIRLTTLDLNESGSLIAGGAAKHCTTSRSTFRHSQLKPSCSGCECTVLSGVFDGFPSYTCGHQEDDGKSTSHCIQIQTPSSRTFDLDSDIGLLLFGFWQDDESKSRLQVHYRGQNLVAIYCVNDGEENCKGCTIQKTEGFGNDEWTRVALFESEGEMSLVADRSACVLRGLNSTESLTALFTEVYSIPVLADGGAIFIGGMYYEKKKTGVYLPSFEHKYFENTREKVPSLRGCLKDVYIAGKLVDLSTLLSEQMEQTLVNADDEVAYAIQVGCAGCSPSCPSGVRCRPTEPRQLTFECDCSDIEEFSLGRCRSTDHMQDCDRIQRPFQVWMKVSLPRQVDHKITISGTFRDCGHRQLFIQFSEAVSLSDDRVHLITLERKTPLGTRHASKKFDLYVSVLRSLA